MSLSVLKSLLIGKTFLGKAKDLKEGQVITEKTLDAYDKKHMENWY